MLLINKESLSMNRETGKRQKECLKPVNQPQPMFWIPQFEVN